MYRGEKTQKGGQKSGCNHDAGNGTTRLLDDEEGETGSLQWTVSSSLMFAWVTVATANQPSRLVVSQNADQIFLAFAHPQYGYQEYLESQLSGVNPAPFLIVQNYGPWNVGDKVRMQQLCKIIAAITLLGSR